MCEAGYGPTRPYRARDSIRLRGAARRRPRRRTRTQDVADPVAVVASRRRSVRPRVRVRGHASGGRVLVVDVRAAVVAVNGVPAYKACVESTSMNPDHQT